MPTPTTRARLNRRGRPEVLDAGRTAIIPLRPLTVGEILDAGFLVVRRNVSQMLGLPMAIAGGLAVWVLLEVGAWFLLGNTTMRGLQIAVVVILGLVGVLALVICLVWVTAILSRITLQTALGAGFAPATMTTWKSALPMLGPILGVAGLQYVALSALQTATGLLYYAGLLASLALGERAALIVQLVVSLLSFAVFALGYGYISLTVPAMANEGRRAPGWIGKPARPTNPLTAFERSFKLVGKQNALRVLGVFAGAIGVALIVTLVLSAGLAGVLALFVQAFGGQVGQVLTNPWAIFGVLAFSVVIALSAAVAYLAGVQTLLYLDLRMRREGLDLALRFDCVDIPQPSAAPVPRLVMLPPPHLQPPGPPPPPPQMQTYR